MLLQNTTNYFFIEMVASIIPKVKNFRLNTWGQFVHYIYIYRFNLCPMVCPYTYWVKTGNGSYSPGSTYCDSGDDSQVPPCSIGAHSHTAIPAYSPTLIDEQCITLCPVSDHSSRYRLVWQLSIYNKLEELTLSWVLYPYSATLSVVPLYH